MYKRRLGSQGLEVSEQGLGCMGMSEFYGTSDEDEAIATIPVSYTHLTLPTKRIV